MYQKKKKKNYNRKKTEIEKEKGLLGGVPSQSVPPKFQKCVKESFLSFLLTLPSLFHFHTYHTFLSQTHKHIQSHTHTHTHTHRDTHSLSGLAEMGTARTQLKAMLRKNWLLKIRHPFITSAEVSLFFSLSVFYY